MSDNPKENEAQESPEQNIDEGAEAAAAETESGTVENGEAGTEEGGQDLKGQLDKALEETERYKDMALRAEAEMQNIRRRAERDVENAHKYGLEKFLQSLLPVVDSLEKAIEAAEASVADKDAATEKDDAILEGVRLCHKLLLDVMAKENVEVVDPEGEPFDPNEHEAVTMVEHGSMEPNSVVTVIQKGYKLNGRLIRPAMVMVSKAPREEFGNDPDKGGRP